MRPPLLLSLFIVSVLAFSGCRSLQGKASLARPTEITVPSEAQVPPSTATSAAQPALPTPAETRPVERTPTPATQLSKLAFIRGGDVWMKGVPAGEEHRLTTDGRNDSPRWSPTGEWLTFDKGEQLWVMRSSGLDPHLVDNLSMTQSAWSPTADRLAYLAHGGLVVVNADGSNRQQIVAPPPGDPKLTDITALAWSPDGQWIAFERLVREAPQGDQPPPVIAQGLWRVKADGSDTQPVYVNPEPLQTQSYLAGWSPHSQRILFWRGMQMSASFAMDGGPLLAVPPIGGTPTEITPATLLHRDFLSWAPDGQHLALVAGGGRSTWYDKAISVVGPGGASQVVTDSGQSASFPAWSPDSRWIAYTAAPAAETDDGNVAQDASHRRHIWRVQPDGKDKRALTNDARFQDERPQWSADGTSILFARLDDTHAQLWQMAADGSDQRVVVDELTPRPDKLGGYGYIDWGSAYDWWTGPATTKSAPLPPNVTPAGARVLPAAPTKDH